MMVVLVNKRFSEIADWFMDTFNIYSPSMKITQERDWLLHLVEKMMLILFKMTRMAPKRQDKHSQVPTTHSQEMTSEVRRGTCLG